MANVIIVKWGILPTYLPYSTIVLPTYSLPIIEEPFEPLKDEWEDEIMKDEH